MGDALPMRAQKIIRNIKLDETSVDMSGLRRAIINHLEAFPCHFLDHTSQIDFLSDFPSSFFNGTSFENNKNHHNFI